MDTEYGYRPHEKPKNPEELKAREVFTNETEVVGPNDGTDFLEALPGTCTILIATKPEARVAGMAHFSLGLYQEGTNTLMREFVRRLSGYEVAMPDVALRIFNGDEMQWTEIQQALAQYGVEMPTAEYMKSQGIRVNKITGEITFFSTFPEE